jgi:hypothetical protein
MHTHKAENEKLKSKVENQQELLLVKMSDQKEDFGNCPICDDRVRKFGDI